MKKIKWNIITSALFFQLLLEKDQSWKNKSKLSNVLSLEISLRSHELDSASWTVSILFFRRLLQTSWPSQKTDQIYVGKAKHARCNLRTQQKRLAHVLKCVEEFLMLELHKIIRVPHIVARPFVFVLFYEQCWQGGVFRVVRNDNFLVFLAVWVLFFTFLGR